MHLFTYCMVLAATQILATALDCSWQPWSAWSMCSVSCGEGQRIRRRRCAKDASCSTCPGSYRQKRKCLGEGIAKWSNWSKLEAGRRCSARCKQPFTRKCRWTRNCTGSGRPKCRGSKKKKERCDCCRCRSICDERTKEMKKCKRCCKCLPPELCQPTLPPAQSLRLPDTLKPHHYDVDIKPDIYGNDSAAFRFDGMVTIYLTCIKPTDSIVLHQKQLHMYNIEVSKASDGGFDRVAANTNKNDDKEELVIKLDNSLSAGDEVKVDLSYYGPIYRDLIGLYLASYTEDDVMKYMVSTQFQPTYARKMFPCMDEPGFKSTFNISVWRKDPMIAVSNMPVYAVQTRENGWFVDHFEKTPVEMSAYLIALAVGELDTVETFSQNNKKVRFIARPKLINEDMASTLSEVAAPMVDFYQGYFDHEYDFPKCDQIAVPAHLAAAMENWGLVTYFEPLLMVDLKYTTSFDLWRAHKVVAHELVHQWIGNAVTIAWWDDLWIQEGLTTYLETKGVAHVQPSWDLTVFDQAYYIYAALEYDQTGSSAPLYKEVVDPNYNFEELFSLITYYKGSALFTMLEKLVFREAPNGFTTSITEFVNQHRYSSYGHVDFLNILQRNADVSGVDYNITEFVFTWIKQMGYPLVTFTRAESGRQVHITQSLFLLNSDKPVDETHPNPYDFKWEVPLSYYTKNDATVQYDWLHSDNKTIALNSPLQNDDWILGNHQHFGYYRTNYDDISWTAIINQIIVDHEVFDALDRGQLLDDAFELGRALKTDQLTAMRLSEYLVNEDAFLPWFSFVSGIAYIDQMIASSAQYGIFKGYIDKISDPVFRKLGWQAQSKLEDSFLQEKVIYLACKYGNVDCITQSKQFFKAWMQDPTNMNIIDANYRSQVYCTALENAYSSTEWDFLFNQYQIVENSFERWMIRDALACSNQQWILQKYFEMGASGNASLNSEDFLQVMLAVAKSYPLGHNVAFDYLNKHWETMSPTKSLILQDIIARYSTKADLQKFENFRVNHPARNDREQTSYENMKTSIKANIKWRTVNNAKLINWLLQSA